MAKKVAKKAAKKATKKTAKKSRTKKVKPDFHRQTVLFQWALSKFGVHDLQGFRDRFQLTPNSAEGLDERTGLHRFFETIANVLPTVSDENTISLDRLQMYEQNILEHTQSMNTARLHHSQPNVDWKYHQYLALLFSELFLDQYFGDADSLRDELNELVSKHNENAPKAELLTHYDNTQSAKSQLARLAFWCATGSGKTLLMHIHIRQFKKYHKQAFDAGKWPKLDQIILVTPNDGLSKQHLTEFKYSGLDAVTTEEQGIDGLFSSHANASIKILDIHKFREEQGKSTVATEAFEGCNLVLVDEGHKGAGRGEGGAWMRRRDQLSKDGFCFEYSATFKEAVQDDDVMRNRYAKSILFDYAYRSFYRDGYGKDFSILNLEDDEKKTRYLTAALLLFYQQMKVWQDGKDKIKPFMIDKPLWVFVGHTVVGKAKGVDDNESVSDVVEVLLFLKDFLSNSKSSIELIQSLLETGFTDSQNRNLLSNKLPHIDTDGNKNKLAKSIHDGILADIFQAEGGGNLAVQLIKGSVGELALKIGENPPFGVVNVGDPSAVADACEKQGIVRLEDDVNRTSLFQGINRDDSSINLLVGSRKFSEGWNSWRVSSLGLMRMGQSEGTQIIQLFGRGVRLRGYKMSLRRSSVLGVKPTQPKNLRQVETLQVFGVKATYMNTFRDWIFNEIPEALDKQIWDLPVVSTLPKRKLKTLQLKENIEGVAVDRGQAFRKLGPLVKLRLPHETDSKDAWIRSHRTRLNWLPRIKGISSGNQKITANIGESIDAPEQSFTPIHIAMLDLDSLLFGLESFKATRGLDRLHVDRNAISALLSNSSWYQLFATTEDMRLDRFENRSQWMRMAQQLLNSYAEKYYRFVRGRWEAPYIEVVELDDEDPSMIDGYTIESTDFAKTTEELDQISEFILNLKSSLKENSLAPWSQWGGRWRTVPFSGHLYQPLFYVGKNTQIKISPIALDKHEAEFIKDLALWCETNKGTEIYLLRNQAVSGLGFFQAANFYPDFLLWVQQDDCQHLAFIDPKGLHHFEPSDPKIQFALKDIPQLQTTTQEQDSSLRLHAFIISNTPFASLGWSKEGGSKLMSKSEIENLGILFQADDSTEYVDTMMKKLLAN